MPLRTARIDQFAPRQSVTCPSAFGRGIPLALCASRSPTPRTPRHLEPVKSAPSSLAPAKFESMKVDWRGSAPEKSAADGAGIDVIRPPAAQPTSFHESGKVLADVSPSLTPSPWEGEGCDRSADRHRPHSCRRRCLPERSRSGSPRVCYRQTFETRVDALPFFIDESRRTFVPALRWHRCIWRKRVRQAWPWREKQ